MSDPVANLTFADIGVAAALLVAPLLASHLLGLGLAARLATSAARAAVQLAVLAYVILEPLFSSRSPLAIGLYLCFMFVVTALEASGRCGYAYPRMFVDALLTVIVSVGSVLALSLVLVLRSQSPWWSPRFLVPIVGMLLGNGMSATVLGLDRVLTELAQRKASVELRLSLGATVREAVRPAIRAAFIAGLTPNLNQLAIVGLVSMPGMLTGQILGGASPAKACAYQLVCIARPDSNCAMPDSLPPVAPCCSSAAASLRPRFPRR